MSTTNKKIKRIQLKETSYDIAVDGIDKVEGLAEQLSSLSKTSSYPNDSGEIKTKYRISLKDNTNTTTRYYKLVTLPINDSNNYASILLEGRIGGWTNDTISDINVVVWNRGTPGMSLLSIASGAVTNTSNIWKNCDLVLIVNSSSATAAATATLYAKCYSTFVFDFDIEVFQSGVTIDYDGTYSASAPTGTLAARASDNINKLELINGKVTVGTKTLLSGSFNSTTGVLTLTTE